jgi:hypothetical protein
MFHESFENGSAYLWLSYGIGLLFTALAIFAVLTGRFNISSEQDITLMIMSLGVGPAFIIAMFLAIHLPHLLRR